MKKSIKAQVTVFIILGIILLFSTGLVLFIRQQVTRRAVFVEPELVPLKNYVEYCINSLTREALFLAGAQGGYVIIPPEISENPSNHLDGPIKVPYWFYNSMSRIPSVGEVEGGIANHIDTYLQECVGDFEEFKEFEVSIARPPASRVIISEKVVDVSTEFELDIVKKADQSTTKIERFATFRESSFGRLYGLAVLIMALEERDSFLENAAVEVIAASELPYAGGELTCEPRQWSIMMDVIPTVKTLILANFQYLLFEPSWRDKADPFEGDKAKWNDYYNKGNTGFKISLGISKFRDVEVKTEFDPAWDFRLNVEPRKGDIVMPVEQKLPLIGQCFKFYNHKYDLEFPIKFTLVDRSQEVPDRFSFATPVIVRKNEPARGGYFSPSFDDLRFKNEDFCDRKEKSVVVRALDAWTNDPIDNASITMQCGTFACEIGTTGVQYTALGIPISLTEFYLTATVPECSGAVFVATKEGYDFGYREEDIGTYVEDGLNVSNDNIHVDILTPRVMPYNFKFRVAEFDGSSFRFRNLASDEQVVLSIIGLGTEFERTVIHPPREGLSGLQEPGLIAGDYTYMVDAKMIKGEKTYAGGYSGNFTTDGREVYANREITFTIISIKDLSDQAGVFSKIFEESGRKELKPAIRK